MKKRIEYIDTLRGMFAIMVILSHYSVAFFPASYWGDKYPAHISYNFDIYMSQSPISIVYNGHFAVCMFMMITAILLSKNVYEGKNIKKMVITRYFRLCLPIFISTIIIFIFIKMNLFNMCKIVGDISGSDWLGRKYNYDATFKDMAITTLFNVFFIPGSGKYNTVLWMMSILFYGSYLTIIISKLFKNKSYKYLIFFMLIVLFYKLNKTYLYYIIFVLGVIITDVFHNYKEIIESKFEHKSIAAIIFIVGIYLSGYPTGVIPTNKLYSFINIGNNSFQIYHTLGSFIVLITVMGSKCVQGALKNNIFLYFGKISFSLYLTHIIVLCSFSCKLFYKLYSITGKYQMSFIITFIPSILLIIGIAHIFDKYVEKKSNKIISKLFDRMFNEYLVEN